MEHDDEHLITLFVCLCLKIYLPDLIDKKLIRNDAELYQSLVPQVTQQYRKLLMRLYYTGKSI
jgi:hypothetical protein